jgi:hypothetical protein
MGLMSEVQFSIMKTYISLLHTVHTRLMAYPASCIMDAGVKEEGA